MKRKLLVVASCMVSPLLTSALHGQTDASKKNEVGLVIGATVTPSVGVQNGGNLTFSPALALGAEYDRHIFGRRAAVYGGVDFLLSPSDVKVQSPPSNVSPQYAYLFLTPHVRVKFSPDRTIQPWLLFGGGYANFAPAPTRTGGVNVQGHGSSGTFEFGGGVDTKPLVRLKKIPLVGELPIGARVEVRDFYSNQPDYGVRTTSSLQNNIVFTGGLVLHF